ncbi:hypothetical protein BJ944DRAFT_248027 [Cunninghamella echinulata]|nr:hypothetical protein BJ944DRAFT_248027 [Cunninghamella echinulata]
MTKELDLISISSESKKSSFRFNGLKEDNNEEHESCKSLFSYLSRQKNKSPPPLTSSATSTALRSSRSMKLHPTLYHNKKLLHDDYIETSSCLSDTDKSSSHNSFIIKDIRSERHSLEDYHHYHRYSPNNNLAWLTKKTVGTTTSASNNNNNSNNNSNNIINNNKRNSMGVAVPANMNPVSKLLSYSETTTEECMAIGRMMIHIVDSYTIQQFLNNYITQSKIENNQKKKMKPTKIKTNYLHEIQSYSSLSSQSLLSSSISPSAIVPHFQSAILPSLSHNIPWMDHPNEFIINNQEEKGDEDKEEYIILPSDISFQFQNQLQPSVNQHYHFNSSKIDYKSISLEMSLLLRQKSTIKELMETESKYIEDLRILVMHFFEVIGDAKCITLEQSEIIVRNGEELLQFHEDFFEALQNAHEYNMELHQLSPTPNIKKIAECFIKWGPKFDIYMDYCVGQDKAMDTYRELLETNDAFSNLMERTHNFLRVSLGFGLGSKLNFGDYLITPFQRVFRYRLILQSIIKTVELDSDEYYTLNKAQDIMHNITTRLNTTKSKLEAEKKTKLFLERLQSDWAIPKRWHSTLGPCILIGTLNIIQDIEAKKIKRYGCALFGTYIIIVKPKKKKLLYEPRLWFPLRMFELKDIEEFDGIIPYAWKLYNDQHTIIFSAMSEQEKQIWVHDFRIAIKDSKAQYETHLWDSQNRGNVIEQLFVSSFDKDDNVKQRQQDLYSPSSSHLSSRSSLRKSLTRRKSTPLFLNNNNNRENSQPSTVPLSNILIESNISSVHLCSTSSDLLIDPVTYHHNMYPNSSKHDLTSTATLPHHSNTTTVKRSQSSMNDLRGFFHSNVTGKWSQHKYSQYQSRRMAVDEKFEDVSSTHLLTARRSQDRNGLF